MSDDSERLRKFMRNVIKVSKRRKEQEKAKDELGKQIEKVKGLAVKKGVKKASISRALKELEKKISEVIKKEKQSIALQEKDISKTKGIASELKSMEEQFSSFTTKDIQAIALLKERIENLEKEKADQIDTAVDELKSKLEDLEKSKSGRDERILELEKKIKEKVSDNFVELMKIEQQLEQMEIKYRKMKQEGKHEKGMLKAFKEKILALKEHAFVKRKNLIEEEIKKGAPLPELPKEFKPKKIRKRKMPHGIIRHDIRIKPVQEQMPPAPKPPEQGNESFEEILKKEHIPVIKLRREMHKKKGFFKRLFG